MEHLFNSVVVIKRLSLITKGGRGGYQWVEQTQLGQIKCRLDLNFLRPGKDAPMPVEAGKAADRYGLCFASPDAPFMSGDRLWTVPNEFGKTPIVGTFEVKQVPDEAQDYADSHHLEFGVVEVAQNVANQIPGAQ